MPSRIIVVVSEPVSADALRSVIGDEASKEAEVLVIAPALTGKARWMLADPDAAIDRAEQVQQETVERLDEAGVDAAGDTGEDDPLLAVQDTLQTYPADRIIFFTHPEGDRNWLEEGVVDEARDRFEPPVEHMTVE
jgi:hypothetical protein